MTIDFGAIDPRTLIGRSVRVSGSDQNKPFRSATGRSTFYVG